MAVDIGPRIGIDGEPEFRKQLNSINTQLRTLSAEAKAVTAQFKGNEDSQEALSAQTKVLTKQIDTQKEKLAMLKKGLEESTKKYGEADDKTQRWAQAVYNAQARLYDLEHQLDRTDSAVDELGDEMDSTAGKGTSFGNILKGNLASNAIMSGLRIVKDYVVGIAQGFADVTREAAVFADDINTMSKITSVDTGTLQFFSYMSDLIDVDLNTLANSWKKLTKSMGTAAEGSGDAYDAFKELGIEIKDTNGAFRDDYDVFLDIIDALGDIDDETQRDIYAMQIFGKSATDLNPLIATGSEALKDYRDELDSMGITLDQTDLDKLNGLNDQLDELKLKWEGFKVAFVTQYSPEISNALGELNDQFSDFIKDFTDEGLLTAMYNAGFKFPTYFKRGWDAALGVFDSIKTSVQEFADSLSNIGSSKKSGTTEYNDGAKVTGGNVIINTQTVDKSTVDYVSKSTGIYIGSHFR